MRYRVLNPDEISAIVDASAKMKERDRLIIRLSYFCAMSPTEVIHLRRENVDRDAKSIRVAMGAEFLDAHPPEIVFSELVSHAFLPPKGWLFMSTGRKCEMKGCEGGHISRKHVQIVFADVLKMAGIERCSAFSLRHTRLTEVAHRTQDAGMVQEIGRFSSLTIPRKYARSEA